MSLPVSPRTSPPVPTSRVLVACASSWDAPARLPRLLSDAGCHVTVTCPEGDGGALSQTRYVHAFAPAPRGASPAEVVTALRHHLRESRYDWVIAADDPLLEALAGLGADALGWAAPWLPVDVGRVSSIVKNGKIEAATIMSVTLSCDHRAVDGALGAELIGAFKKLIENPVMMVV